MVPEVQHLNLAPEPGTCPQAFRPVSWPCLQHLHPPASLEPLFTAGRISLWHCLCINTAMTATQAPQSPAKPHCKINNSRGTKGFSRQNLLHENHQKSVTGTVSPDCPSYNCHTQRLPLQGTWKGFSPLI